MVSYKDLPQEILQLFFDSLEGLKLFAHNALGTLQYPPKDMLQCQLTCKLWSRPAQQKLYKDVYIGSLQNLKLFIATLRDSQDNLGLLVESIYLNSASHVYIHHGFLATFSQICAAFVY